MLFISKIIYNLFIRLYEYAVYLVSFQNNKALLWYNGRKDIFERLRKALIEDKDKHERIWMHCASLGEFEQGRPLLEALRTQKPDALIFLTFFSPSGYEIRKKYPNADHVFYLPSDTPTNAREFIRILKPTLAIAVKYEFWYNYFNELYKAGIPFILISAIFRKKQPFFTWYGLLHRKMLTCFTHIFVQDEASVSLLKSIGFSNVSQINDTRVDRVANIAAHALSLPTLEIFLSGGKAFVAGSAYDTENELIHQAWKAGLIKQKIIIVPHQVDQAHIEKIRSGWGDHAAIYTTFSEKEDSNKNILIVDTVGLLSNIYKYADAALIGGGFGNGIHNTLEPAAFGLPILFGPKYHKFMEAIEMVESEAAYNFSDYASLVTILKKLGDEAAKIQAGQKASDYIRQHTGGTEAILKWLSVGSRM